MSDILYILQNKSLRLEKSKLDQDMLAGVVIPGHYEREFLPERIDDTKIHDSDTFLVNFPHETPAGSHQFIEFLLRDPRTQYLAERRIASRSLLNESKKAQRWVRLGAFGNSFLISVIAINCLELMKKIKPKVVLCDSTPHDIMAWIAAKAAEYLSVPIVICKLSPMHWRFGYCYGTDSQIWLTTDISGNGSRLAEEAKIEHLIRLNRQGYSEALPSYMKAHASSRLSFLQKTFKAEGSFARPLLDWLRRLDLLRRIRKSPYSERRWGACHAAYDKYESYCELERTCAHELSLAPSQEVVTFFLHYQWERTSLPEGGVFSQQIQAIIWLREWLPQHVTLFVKEHPVMLKKYTSNTLRPEGFYSFISSLRNVELVSPDIDSFELIDASTVVSTITGTVGFQALCRRRPVVAFGSANYLDHPAAYHADDKTPDFASLTNRFNRHAPEFTSEYLKEFLLEFLPYTVSGDNEYGDPYSLSGTAEAQRKTVIDFSAHWKNELFRKHVRSKHRRKNA